MKSIMLNMGVHTCMFIDVHYTIRPFKRVPSTKVDMYNIYIYIYIYMYICVCITGRQGTVFRWCIDVHYTICPFKRVPGTKVDMYNIYIYICV
jgi:hypothetical protein